MAKAYDVCIVGGGVVGLWVARRLADAGADCVLLERTVCGSGASGGILGALMAHAPDNWNVKKQFQFDALAELPSLIERLESETGVATGYAQCGRIMPVRTERFRQQAQVRSEASREHWRASTASFAFELKDTADLPAIIEPDVATLGFIHDRLAARINPANYVEALHRSIESSVDVIEGCRFEAFNVATGEVRTTIAGQKIVANHLVMSAGYETFGLLNAMLDRTIGGGVKGQAALFNCPELTDHPIIYDDGIYVVPHEGGLCAVGSTTEKQWTDPSLPDSDCNDFIERAQKLCPPLRDAHPLRRWAGVRPRCNRTDPIIGRLDEKSKVLVATGGYKITFGIAHRMAQCITDDICGLPEGAGLPETFKPAHHLQDRD
ncbi:MAG: FAD-dependent oxidoreductase [Pseudomonadota bacterium]